MAAMIQKVARIPGGSRFQCRTHLRGVHFRGQKRDHSCNSPWSPYPCLLRVAIAYSGCPGLPAECPNPPNPCEPQMSLPRLLQNGREVSGSPRSAWVRVRQAALAVESESVLARLRVQLWRYCSARSMCPRASIRSLRRDNTPSFRSDKESIPRDTETPRNTPRPDTKPRRRSHTDPTPRSRSKDATWSRSRRHS